MKKETKVNCEVESCKYNEDERCCLEELEISCTCDNDDCEEIEETVCRSFEKRDELDEDKELEYDEYDDGYEIVEDDEFDDIDDIEDDKDFEEELDDDYDEELDEELEENDDEEIIDTYIEKEDY